MYEYRVKWVEVVDGDTLRTQLDLGLDVGIKLTLRLYGLNAPELRTTEGQAAKAFLLDLLDRDEPLRIRTIKDRREKYGRYLAILFYASETTTINDQLLEAGHAVPYPSP